MKKILFISHDARRAGAPILLLRSLKLIAQNNSCQFDVLVKNTGPLVPEFEQLAPTYIWNSHHKPFNSDSMAHLYSKLNIWDNFHDKKQQKYQSKLINQIKQKNYDLVVANTIATGDILMAIGKLNCPIVSYLHELNLGFSMFSKPEFVEYQLQNTKQFWVPSMAVKLNLIKNHQISEQKIIVLTTIIDEKKGGTENVDLKTQLGIQANTTIIGTVGTLDIRKGYDIFVQVAALCSSHKMHFVWLGANTDSLEYKIVKEELIKLGLENRVSICSNSDNPSNFYLIIDILLIPSREDPYPLVTLEAAQHSKPTVCFDNNAGGAADFVAEDCGIVVPYLNITSMALVLQKLGSDTSLRKHFGQNALEKVNTKHNPAKGYTQIMNLINNMAV